MRHGSVTFLILLFVAAVGASCIFLDKPPREVAASAPPGVFSAERAMAHLKAFAQKPHPIGSEEHDAVRDYLIAQLRALGTNPEIQNTIGVTPIYQVAGRVENIVVRLKGSSGDSGAALLVAHYDSVPAGPGAGDDGSGVAALLETVRALRSGPPLKNDIIFLMSDGEEEGMLGASAFATEHPWAKNVRVAANFEARGTAGPSMLFETSDGNGLLVSIFAQSAPHPAGSSFTYEVYKHMPNDTDLTILKHTGAAALNFAFIGNWEAYHTPLDNASRLDRGSLQQQGEYALSLARAFGNADLSKLRARDAVYFSIPQGAFFYWSSRTVWPLAILALGVLLGLCYSAVRRSATNIKQILHGALAGLTILAVLLLAAIGFHRAAGWLHLYVLADGNLAQNPLYAASLVALITGVGLFLYKAFRAGTPWLGFLLGSYLIVVGFLFAAAEWMPGGGYLVLWPLFAALAGTGVLLIGNERGWWELGLVCVFGVPPLVLLVSLVTGFYHALGFTATGAPAMAFALFLLVVTLLPLVEIVVSSSGNVVALVTLCLALFLFLGAAITTRYSPRHPKPSMLAYALDADTQHAMWTSSARRADDWTAQYVGSSPLRAALPGFYPEWYRSEFLQHVAPAIAVPPPQMDLLENSVTDGTRMVRVRIVSPRHARVIALETPDSDVLEASIEGHRLGLPAESRWNKSGKWGVQFANPPAEGIELRLRAKGTGAIKLVVVDRSMGLPEIPGMSVAPRPKDSMPQHSGDQTLVRRSFVF